MKRIVMLTILVGACVSQTSAQSTNKPRAVATIQVAPDGSATFAMEGTAPHFGRFVCYGEVVDGEGVAVLQAANGDLIVGVITFHMNTPQGSQVHFSWRDSVQFSDGTTVTNTGRFAKNRPPGVVIAIIAILIG